MDVRVERDDSTATVSVTGDVDVTSAYEMYLAVSAEAEEGYSRVVLDLAGVDFIDSVGLGMLVRCQHELRARESSLALRAPSAHVASLLRLTSLATHFDVA